MCTLLANGSPQDATTAIGAAGTRCICPFDGQACAGFMCTLTTFLSVYILGYAFVWLVSTVLLELTWVHGFLPSSVKRMRREIEMGLQAAAAGHRRGPKSDGKAHVSG